VRPERKNMTLIFWCREEHNGVNSHYGIKILLSIPGSKVPVSPIYALIFQSSRGGGVMYYETSMYALGGVPGLFAARGYHPLSGRKKG